MLNFDFVELLHCSSGTAFQVSSNIIRVLNCPSTKELLALKKSKQDPIRIR
jgi:hypothetical protein